MGVCINYKLGQQKVYIKKNLDSVEIVAGYYKKEAEEKNIPFTIERLNDYTLLINIGGCETLALEFKSVKEIIENAKNGWDYMYAVLTDDGKKELEAGYEIEKYPENEQWYCAGFTKTQFCENIIEHSWVANLIRCMASRCRYVEINDEADYYYSDNLENAKKAIKENGALINSISGKLEDLGYKKENIVVNKTIIK